MNSGRRITLGQLGQATSYKPASHASDFTGDKLRVLGVLEQAGTAGCTTRELMERGGGMRPPNRIGDLRDDGYAIKTIPEGRGVFRYVLCKFLPEEKAKAETWGKLQREPVRTDSHGRPLADDLADLPLFAGVRP